MPASPLISNQMKEYAQQLKHRVVAFLDSDTDECLPYLPVNADGYGDIQTRIKRRKKHVLAHRLVFALKHDTDLTSCDVILHQCDNPACCNPRHLSKGTHASNVADKVAKNRQAKGKANGRYTTGYHSKVAPVAKPETIRKNRSTIPAALAQTIKELIETGNGTTEIARTLSIPRHQVQDIKRGKSWAAFAA